MRLIDRILLPWTHTDRGIQKSTVSELTDGSQLIIIAESNPSGEVREAAFNLLNDQGLLAKIAKGTGEFKVRAAERLTERQHIIEVARHAASPEVRAAAVARIDDPRVLRQIASLDQDPSVRRSANRKRTLPDAMRRKLTAILAKLELAYHPRKLTSPIDLTRPPWAHTDGEIQKSAVSELPDGSQLIIIAETNPNGEVREAAFNRLNDQGLLAKIAKGTGEFNVRAAERLVEPRHILEVARQAAAPKARSAAVARITDPYVLRQIAVSDEDPSVRRCAKWKHDLPDGAREYLTAVLSKLEITYHPRKLTSPVDRTRPPWAHPGGESQEIAGSEFPDAARLSPSAETDPKDEMCEAEFNRLDAQDLLAQLAMGTGKFNVRAVERLTEPRHIIEVACCAAAPRVRAEAVARIEDPQVLHRIASFDEDPLVRRCAKWKHTLPNGTREYLAEVLSKLEIAEQRAGSVAEFCGSLDDLCGAIVADRRFQIDGVVVESCDGEAGDHLPHAPETVAPFSSTAKAAHRQFLELLGGRNPGNNAAVERIEPVLFRLKIWRIAEDSYACFLEERRVSLSHDVVAWSNASRFSRGFCA